jgi:hypothetical protein
MLATASWDRSVREWLVHWDQVKEDACHRLVNNLPEKQWDEYGLGDDPGETCPGLPRR